MKNFNQAVIIGTIARKPSVFDNTKHKKATFTVIEKSKRNDQEFSNYIPCEAWGSMAEIAESLEAGIICTIIGKVKSSSYEKDGQKVWKTVVDCMNIIPAVPF